MTNEEAINQLEGLAVLYRHYNMDKQAAAFDVAIQALRGWQAVDSLKDEADVLAVVFQRDDARTKCTVERHSWSSACDIVVYGPTPATAALAAESEKT